MLPDNLPAVCIVMGTSSCGKSTIGAKLAEAFDVPFVDGDSLHPQSNIDKMSRGEPLHDDDRAPWLRRIHQVGLERARATLQERRGIKGRKGEVHQVNDDDLPLGMVIACSALKEAYRNILRGITDRIQNGQPPLSQHTPESEVAQLRQEDTRTLFIYLKASQPVLLQRIKAREGHFMKESMLQSQFDDLEEPPTGQEEKEDVIIVDVNDQGPEAAAKEAELKIRRALTKRRS